MPMVTAQKPISVTAHPVNKKKLFYAKKYYIKNIK